MHTCALGHYSNQKVFYECDNASACKYPYEYNHIYIEKVINMLILKLYVVLGFCLIMDAAKKHVYSFITTEALLCWHFQFSVHQ